MVHVIHDIYSDSTLYMQLPHVTSADSIKGRSITCTTYIIYNGCYNHVQYGHRQCNSCVTLQHLIFCDNRFKLLTQII